MPAEQWSLVYARPYRGIRGRELLLPDEGACLAYAAKLGYTRPGPWVSAVEGAVERPFLLGPGKRAALRIRLATAPMYRKVIDLRGWDRESISTEFEPRVPKKAAPGYGYPPLP